MVSEVGVPGDVPLRLFVASWVSGPTSGSLAPPALRASLPGPSAGQSHVFKRQKLKGEEGLGCLGASAEHPAAHPRPAAGSPRVEPRFPLRRAQTTVRSHYS